MVAQSSFITAFNMTRFFNTLAMIILFTTAIADGFTFGRTTTKTSAARQTKSSPLLPEALASYPFNFRPNTENSGTESTCSTAFNELARLYGDQEALAIIKLEPRSLTFRSDYFAPCLEAWTEQFGLEASQAMVGRNPGLLGVRPAEAEQPAEASMALSWVVAVTRPLPKVLAVGGLLAILTSGMR